MTRFPLNLGLIGPIRLGQAFMQHMLRRSQHINILKMTSRKELFGGAISIELPNLIDASYVLLSFD